MVFRLVETTNRASLAGMLRRILAAACIATVLSFVVVAASPELHGKLHGGSHDPGSDTCAVALFAAGVTMAVPVMAQPPSVEAWSEFHGVATSDACVGSPRYLHLPGRAPPVG